MPLSPLHIGALPAGTCNSISDVAGVTVGRATTAGGDIQTGVTIVCPHAGNPFVDKVPAASVVLNGFGESIGLVQVDEPGVLETPITLANTFAVGAVAQAQIRQTVAANLQIGRTWSTVSPPVLECNDGYLNDLQAFTVQEVHYDVAYAAAAQALEQGVMGAGCGMSSFGTKGGIGSASRVVILADGTQRTAGAFVLSNFGVTKSLTLGGRSVGAELVGALAAATPGPEKGPVIMLVATDVPLDACQLRRLVLRTGAGLAYIDSAFGYSSGDIVLALSTAYTVLHEGARATPAASMTHESHLDPLFQTVVDNVEQAIVHAPFHVTAVTGRDGDTRCTLTELL